MIKIPTVAERGARLPAFQTKGAAGADVHAFLPVDSIVIHPGNYVLVPTGIRMAIPCGYEVQIRPRSGLAAKFGVTVLNSPGTIDSDYRGEIKVILINHGKEDFVVKDGDRIAQMVVSELCAYELVNSDSLDETDRGEGGFNSTGI